MTTTEWAIVGISGAGAVMIIGWAILSKPKKRHKKKKKKTAAISAQIQPQRLPGGGITWQTAPTRAALK